MQVCDRHANEHTALKRLGGDFTDRKKGWRCSLDRISKVYRYRHQKTKLKIKFHLYIGDSCHQNIKKYVTWGLKSRKFYVFFPCNPMEPFISGVRPYRQCQFFANLASSPKPVIISALLIRNRVFGPMHILLD